MSSTENAYQQIEQLLADEEIELAAVQLLSMGRSQPPGANLRASCVAFSAAVTRLSRQRGTRQITDEQWTIERSRLVETALFLLSEFRRSEFRVLETPTVAASTVRFPTTEEKIIGANRIKSLAWVRRCLEAARSIGRLQTPRGFGSAFLVAGEWAVTNHHVLATADETAAAVLRLGYDDDASPDFEEYRLDPRSYESVPELDVAKARLVHADGSSFKRWGELRVATLVPALAQFVSIIQHPRGGPKKVALSENQVVGVFGHRLQYLTDTEPGSSGSPVFDDDWRVVAVHHAGGNLQKNDRGERHFVNEAILMSAAAPALRI